ncbi:MAG: hypothetical protein JWQ25_79 [Daejeonella sp.]|nr:hypothetical protein [Daejeonella sp.]
MGIAELHTSLGKLLYGFYQQNRVEFYLIDNFQGVDHLKSAIY